MQVFINEKTAGALKDQLATHGAEEKMPDGVLRFQAHSDEISGSLSGVDLTLVVIGPRRRQRGGTAPLDDPDDFIRVAIATALKSGSAVVPVLVEGVLFRGLPPDLTCEFLVENQTLSGSCSRLESVC